MTTDARLDFYQKLPSRMEFETKENKKAGYSSLAKEVHEAVQEALNTSSFDELVICATALTETLMVTSQEIYEHYRSIANDCKAVIKAALNVQARHMRADVGARMMNSDEEMQEKRMLATAIEKACTLRILIPEKYLTIAQELIGESHKGMSQQEAETIIESVNEEFPKTVKLSKVLVTGRSVTILIEDGGKYNTCCRYDIYVNGCFYRSTDCAVTSVYGLEPDKEYEILVSCGLNAAITDSIRIRTLFESLTLNVKDFGAKGDGISDDTHFIQAAILCCPKDGRVLIPEGIYRITQLFFKSHVRIELAKGAELRADRNRESFVRFPALAEYTNESGEMNLGTWEGNPLPMFAGIICGVQVEDVILYGEGIVNGNATKEDWWKDPKVMRIAFRPRTFFINECKNICVQGVKFCNSPSWTIHPFFSDDLIFANVTVENPSDSPNTDGLDPESCKNVEIAGVRFTLGDDCIAIKSGKIYMGRKYKQPSENLKIHHCLMENGHGAVTIGSEMAGGVRNLEVKDCIFRRTDRGLRIKTRRGRGEDAIVEQVTFANIDMDHVMTPFVANSFYFCDPDGRTSYVQSREVMPVDEGTPYIKTLRFTDIKATNCHVAAAHFDGLPERKIDEIYMENVFVSYAAEPKCDVPAMSEGVEPCSLKGIFASNVKRLVLKNVEIAGQEGEPLRLVNVDELVEK